MKNRPDGRGINQVLEKNIKLITIEDTCNGLDLVNKIFQRRFREVEIFKDNAHSYVAHIVINHQCFVLKIHRSRNNNGWHRFLTLFKDGESLRRFKSMVRLQELGFKTPEPVLAAEKRNWGMVTYDCLLYRFATGEQGDCRHSHLIVSELINLHHLGYLRRDAHAKNFLINGENVVFIDFRLKNPLFFRKLRLRAETSKYLKNCPVAVKYIPQQILHSQFFRFGVRLERVFSFLKKSRRHIKRLLPQIRYYV